MRKLFRYLKIYRKECILGPLFKLLEASFELLVPLVMAAIIDRGIAGSDRSLVLRLGLVLAGLGLVGLASAITAQYFAAKASVGFAAALRHQLFAHIQRLSFPDLDRLGSDTLITRMTSDVNQVQTGVNLALRLLLRSPFVVFGAMVMALTIDFQAALVFAAVIAALCAVVFGIMLWSIPRYQTVQKNLDGLLGLTRENLGGVRVLRAFNKQADEVRQFDAQNERLTRFGLFVGRVSAAMNPLTYVLLNLALVVLIHTGALQVDAGVLTQGQVVALVNYMSQILVELVKMANLILTITKAWACGNRLEQLLEVPAAVSGHEAAGAADAPAVVFDHVSLTYPGAGGEAICDLSFTIPRGTVFGIIGGTGSGKSSVVNLIPGFYKPTRGQVLVDGLSTAQWEDGALRARVGMAPQKAMLFRGTIRENLLWGDSTAPEAQLERALELSQSKEFVDRKDGGLDAPVEQGGRNLSGGQRQRLTIARAVVREPEILILDDSASALDFATDAKLRKALRTLRDTTVILVSQRASSIRFADQILVLDDGRAVGLGTHDALLETCPVYQEICASQFRKEA
ncbi:MAG: ABC transporter ATP-binding protein [Oscillospiraceae bacterium]|nr:ABC transporter ATP-binding protein [Oscillospiraceae bacterium]